MRLKSKFAIELLGILGKQINPASPEVGMIQQSFQQPAAQSFSAMLGCNDDVTEIPHRRMIGDNAGESDLPASPEQAKVQ